MSRYARRIGPAVVGLGLWAGATATLLREHGQRLLRPVPRKTPEKRPPMKRLPLVLAGLVFLGAGAALYGGFHLFGRGEATLTSRGVGSAPALMIRYGCAGCHTIPGVPGARGKVGPPLAGLSGRLYVGGSAINSPDTLARWLVNPRAFDPRTAMPVTGISETDARAVAVWLLTP